MMSELCKDTKIIWRRIARYEGNRILQIDHGTITLLMFLINGSMGRECQKFYSHFAQMLSEKRDHPQSISSNWIRTKVSFGLLTWSMLCLRGSRTVCRKTAEFETDVGVTKISTRWWSQNKYWYTWIFFLCKLRADNWNSIQLAANK